MSRFLVILEAVLETEALVFLLHDFGAGPFWRVFLPLAAHCMAVALLAIGFVRRWDFSKPVDRSWAAIGMCLTLPLPLLGFLGFVVVWALISSGPRSRGDLLRDFQEYISYDPALANLARRGDHSDRFIMDEVDVSPLRDILAGRDLSLKRGAILSLARLPRRDAVSLLKGALADASREIRYYASTALSDMEKEFNDRIFRLVREIERSPTNVERHVELARIIQDYTDAGLLDEGMIRYFLDIGLRALDKATMVGSKDRRIDLLSANLLHRAGDLERADAAIIRYVDAAPEDFEAVLLAAEIAFERRDLPRAREVLRHAEERFPGHKRLAEVRGVVAG